MNLNGGYIMLDLDDTSGLLDRVKKVYDSGKPLIVKYGDRLQFANFAKRASTSSNFDITLSNNTRLNIHYFSGALTEMTVVNTTKYKHIIAFTIGSGSDTRKFIFDILSNESRAQTSVQTTIQFLKSAGYESEDTATLCLSTGGYAHVYATLSGSTYTLHYKVNGADPYYTVTNGTFISDTVVNL